MLQHYFKIIFRNLWKSKLYSVINITGLALGLTCCMLIVLYNKDEVSFDQFHQNKNQIFRVVAEMNNGNEPPHKLGISNSPVGPAFKEDIPEVQSFVRLQSDQFIIKKANTTFNQEAIRVDTNFFKVFTFPLVAGDPATSLKDPNAVILTEETAQKYFGTTDVIGKTLDFKVDEKFEPRIITGVVKKSPQNSSIRFEALVPFTDKSTEWMGFYLNTFVELDAAADYKKVAAKLDKVFLSRAASELKDLKEKFDFKGSVHYSLQPFTQIHLDPSYETVNGVTDGSRPMYSYILSGIAFFILLIACINFVNLTVAHSIKRGKEIGVRKVMGGLRQQLIRQFLGESFLLGFIAFTLAIVLTILLLPLFNELANKQLSFGYLLDVKLIVLYAALFIITSFSAGFYPAIVLSRFSPVQTLYNRHKFTGKNLLTKGLVVFQFSLATFLIITTIIVYSQFNFLTHKNLGYNDKDLLIVNMGSGVEQRVTDLFKSELSKDPSIQIVAAKNGGYNETVANADGKEINFSYNRMDENYLAAMQIPMLKGRNFSTDFPSDSTESLIINETFAKQAGWADPIGKKVDFTWAKKIKTVVGVVRDYHYESLQRKIGPQLFVADPGFRYGDLYIKVKPDNIPRALKLVEATYKKILPVQPYKYDFMNTINLRQYEAESKWKQIITFAAILSIFISCIGLFGLTTLATEKRTKEIGVRKVLGASVQSLVALLSFNFVKLVLLGFIIASPIAWFFTNKWLQNFPYHISLSVWVFAGTAALMIALASVTISYQSIKAALSNPVTSLKVE